ncbi:orotidine-5'-phosphate decarboxylase [Candidatus Peregrinibacteria bacterium]|nr:orotidine-5'-phosphate decarboxylase [Candidatus Peregrinibacteria bacterium]
MTKNFADKLIEAVRKKGNPICVGLDPRLDKIPESIKQKALMLRNKDGEHLSPMAAAAEAVIEFNKGIIDAVHDLVPVVKPQIAFYEIFGADGVRAYVETLKYAKKKGLLTIADAKRNDIGSTAEAYAQAFLGEVSIFEDFDDEVVMPVFEADSLTINPYLGWDGIKPFVEEAGKYGKGVFVLVKTSNKSSGDLQDLEMKDGKALYEIVGHLVESWGADEVGENGYSFVGAVVGATYPEQAKKLREVMPRTIFLVPGYGAQGGGAADVKPCFNKDGLGAIVNNSRGIIFAYEKQGLMADAYTEAARTAVIEMKKDLEGVL